MALLLVVTGLALGGSALPQALLIIAVVYGYGTVVTLVTLAVEEVTFHTYPRWRDLGAFVLASLLESFGYRQLSAWWRVRGLWAQLRGERPEWGTGARQTFEEDSAAVSVLRGDG